MICIFVDILLKVKNASSIFCQNLLIFFPIKNRSAKSQIMKNKSCREDITDGITFRGHISNINDFRCHKTRRSTTHEQIFFFFCESSKPKITNNKIIGSLFSKHNIFWFQIAMNNSFLGQCLKST